MVEMIQTSVGYSTPMLPDDGLRDQIKPDIWIKPLRLSPYEAGRLLPERTKFHNPVFEKLKNLGHGVEMPRLFDLLEITICSTREQSILLMAALAHNREISLSHRIVLPSEQIVDVVLWNVFVADTKTTVALNKQSNKVEQHLNLNLYATDNTTIDDAGYDGLIFDNEDQNFRLQHPLLSLLCAVSSFKEKKVSNVRRIALKPHGVLPLNNETNESSK